MTVSMAEFFARVRRDHAESDRRDAIQRLSDLHDQVFLGLIKLAEEDARQLSEELEEIIGLLNPDAAP